MENKEPKIQKILSFIQKESIKNILKLKGLSPEDKKDLQVLVKNC